MGVANLIYSAGQGLSLEIFYNKITVLRPGLGQS